MTQLRFGRKIPLPSTTEIKHEIRLMVAADALATAASPAAMNDILRDIAGSLGLPAKRTQTLIQRFGTTPA